MDLPEPTSPTVDPAARIERLLAEVRAAASPMVWERVDALMQAVVELYGDGLGRLVAGLEPDLRHRLAGDELVASLLALHGLHPLPAETRISRALDELAPQLGTVELVALADGVARVRLVDAPRQDPNAVAEAVNAVIAAAAPEVQRVEIDGLREAGRGPLVQIDLQRSRVAR
jgi:hypothetical protein